VFVDRLYGANRRGQIGQLCAAITGTWFAVEAARVGVRHSTRRGQRSGSVLSAARLRQADPVAGPLVLDWLSWLWLACGDAPVAYGIRWGRGTRCPRGHRILALPSAPAGFTWPGIGPEFQQEARAG
jgi:hypothetical protein